MSRVLTQRGRATAVETSMHPRSATRLRRARLAEYLHRAMIHSADALLLPEGARLSVVVVVVVRVELAVEP